MTSFDEVSREMWASDCERLLACNPNFPVADKDSAGEVSSAVQDALQERWRSKRYATDVGEELVRSILSSLVPEVERVWGDWFGKPPNIEVVESSRVIDRQHELEADITERAGYENPFSSLPCSSAYFPNLNLLFISDRQLIVSPQPPTAKLEGGTLRIELNSAVEEYPWDRSTLEFTLGQQLIMTKFYRDRGDVGDAYIDMARALGESGLGKVKNVGAVVSARARDMLVLDHPRWGLDFMLKKLSTVWSDPAIMIPYFSTVTPQDSMKTFSQYSLLDDFVFRQEGENILCGPGMNQRHPRSSEKILAYGANRA